MELAEQRQEYVAQLARDLDAVTRQLSGMPEVRRVILFGSYAAGRRDLLTDLDLLVEMESSSDYLTRNIELAGRLSASVAMDVMAYTPQELDKMRDRPFVRRALMTGQVLYERRAEG